MDSLSGRGKDLYMAEWIDRIQSDGGEARGFDEPSGRPSPGVSTSELVGQEFGGYTLLAEIGRGGMGQVFRARRAGDPGEVALKLLPSQDGAKREFARRFRREIEINFRLAHPGLVKILDAGTEGDVQYLVMELVEGRTLRQHLEKEKDRSLIEGVRIVREVAESLRYLHGKGILHRDLKPANILLGKGGAVKLADFGLARTLDQTTMTRHSQVLGTICYVAPEVLRSGRASAASDVYALGLILYELLTSRFPFFARNLPGWIQEIEKTVPEAAHLLNAEVPLRLSAMVARLLTKDPAERPGLEALIDELAAAEKYCAHRPSAPRAAGPSRERARIAPSEQVTPKQLEVPSKKRRAISRQRPAMRVEEPADAWQQRLRKFLARLSPFTGRPD